MWQLLWLPSTLHLHISWNVNVWDSDGSTRWLDLSLSERASAIDGNCCILGLWSAFQINVSESSSSCSSFASAALLCVSCRFRTLKPHYPYITLLIKLPTSPTESIGANKKVKIGSSAACYKAISSVVIRWGLQPEDVLDDQMPKPLWNSLWDYSICLMLSLWQ